MHGLLDELESAHAQIAAELGEAPPERIVVMLYAGTAFWESTGQTRQVSGLYDGKVRVPAGRLTPPSELLRSVLRHEITHAFVDALSGGRADFTWQEGLAEHFERQDITTQVAALRAACRNGGDAWPPRMSHETAHARMEWFLSRYGMAGARDVLAALRSRGTLEGALQEALRQSDADLDAAWCRDLAAGAH